MQLTPKRQIETPQYAAMVRRVVAALGRRVGSGDIAALREMYELEKLVDDTMRDTVLTLNREHGYSWADIGRELGVTRQAAQQRWAGYGARI